LVAHIISEHPSFLKVHLSTNLEREPSVSIDLSLVQ
jgi:hypothetical protein